MHVLPAKSDQFAHSQPGVDRNKNHRGVRFRDEFHESRKLIRFDEGLERLPPLAGGKPQALDGVVHEQAVAFGGAENAGQYVANLVLRFVAKWKLSQSRQVLLQREWSQLAEAHFSERRRQVIFDDARPGIGPACSLRAAENRSSGRHFRQNAKTWCLIQP